MTSPLILILLLSSPFLSTSPLLSSEGERIAAPVPVAICRWWNTWLMATGAAQWSRKPQESDLEIILPVIYQWLDKYIKPYCHVNQENETTRTKLWFLPFAVSPKQDRFPNHCCHLARVKTRWVLSHVRVDSPVKGKIFPFPENTTEICLHQNQWSCESSKIAWELNLGISLDKRGLLSFVHFYFTLMIMGIFWCLLTLEG